MTDGDVCAVAFLALLAALVAFHWLVADGGDDGWEGGRWCPLECRPGEGQDAPCPDCPYLKEGT